jgi:hypothetical protein
VKDKHCRPWLSVTTGGAWVTELVDLSAWSTGTRLLPRRERPHPGAPLRITDLDGHRIVGMLTNTPGGQLPDPGVLSDPAG